MKSELEKNKLETTLKLKSLCKLNLGLWVKEKRSDGFHEIETIFFESDVIFDEIKIDFKEGKDSLIEVLFNQNNLNKSIPMKKNIAYKAAELFFKEIGVPGQCNILINKRIPMEAGLGGGSSNAATVLKGLNQIFKLPVEQRVLLRLAGQLGSDVPFFVLGGACEGKGRGEVLTPLAHNLHLDIKIIKPEGISISTKWAYEMIDSREFCPDHDKQIEDLKIALESPDYELLFKNIFNDFEIIAFSSFPKLIEERKKLLAEGYNSVCLCGSGSALFGIRKGNNSK